MVAPGCSCRKALRWRLPRKCHAIFFVTLTAALLAAAFPGASRSVCYDWDSYIHQVSALHTSIMDDVQCVGGYAYGAGYTSGLLIARITDPGAPVIVSQYSAPGARAVRVAGHHAYLVGSFGLQILDVGNPFVPTLIGSCPLTGGGTDVAVQGTTALVAANEGGTYIIDVSAPANPHVLGNIGTTTYACGVAFWPEDPVFIYIAEETRFVCAEISNPAHPIVIGILSPPDFLRGLAYADRKVYLLGIDALHVVDVSHVDAPVLLGSLANYGGYDAEIRDGIAYVGDWEDGLCLVDVTNPRQMRLISQVRSDLVESVGLSGDYVCAAGNSGLGLIDVRNPNAPLLGRCATPTAARQIAAVGSRAHVGRDHGMSVLDISDPRSPLALGQLSLPGYVRAIVASGHYALVGCDTGLEIVDVADPANPVLAAHFAAGDAYGLALDGDVLYVADHNDYLRIIDVTNPLLPIQTGSVRPGGGPGGLHTVAVHFPWAYVSGCIDSFFVIDVSNPAAAHVVGSIGGSAYYRMAARGDYVFTPGFVVINVADPAHPFEVASLPEGGGDVALTDDKAYVATGSGISVVDIADPVHPVHLGATYVNGDLWDLGLHEGLVLMANGGAGLAILPLRCEPAAAPEEAFDPRGATLIARPNPAWETVRLECRLATAANAQVDVFDIAGRRVRGILQEGMTAGPHEIIWDGRDDAGRRVPTGIYLIRLDIGDRRTATRVALLR